MEAKLTLKLDSGAIRRAKSYVRSHRGTSLSRLVENYFNSLARESMPRKDRIPPIVSSLVGAAKRTRRMNVEKEYTNYLIEKYK